MAEAQAKVTITGDAAGLDKAMRQAGVAFNGLGASLKGVLGSVFNLRTALTGLATTGIIGMGVKFNAEMEQARIAFTTMLGSAQKAKAFLQEMQSFAAKTPFEFPDVQDAARRFLALGFSARDVIPTLRTVGDAVAALGGGKEMINGVVMALGQMKTKGTVQAEELLQLAERGIPAYEILQKKLKLTGDEVQNIGKAGISADVASQALLQGMNERFAGAMQAQSRTLAGLWSTLKDNMMMLLGQATESLSSWLEGLMPKLIEITDKMREAFARGGFREALAQIIPREMVDTLYSIGQAAVSVARWLVDAARWIKEHWSVIGPILAGALGAIASIEIVLKVKALINVINGARIALMAFTASNPILLAVSVAIGLLVAAGYALYRNWDKVSRWFADTWAKLRIVVAEAIKGILVYVERLLGWIPGVADKVAELRARMDELQATESKAIEFRAYLADLQADANGEYDREIERLRNHQQAAQQYQHDVDYQSRVTKEFNFDLSGLAASHDKAAESAEKQTDKLKNLEEQMAKTAKQAAALYGSALGGARQAVSQGLLSYGEARAYAGSVVKQELGEEGLKAAWQELKKTYYEATPEALANMFKFQYGVEPPKLALGGIVSRPTLAMIGERGPEAVVPLDRMPPSVNVNLTVNVNGSADRADAYGLARQISDILKQELRQQRLAWR